ncbi:MAG TPA: hypothetical protein VKR06_39960 [Ktedonosporobacter sp.]|nr:hypothetical protein [Ktedonosporobacter sp.]
MTQTSRAAIIIFSACYHDPIGMLQARVISNTTLLFIQTHITPGENGPDSEEALWKINTDGSQPVQLLTSPGAGGYWFDFADDRQPWPTLSRDGSLYVVTADGEQSLVIGSLSGSPTLRFHAGSAMWYPVIRIRAAGEAIGAFHLRNLSLF